MRRNLKRYRQTSIFEAFELSKKSKTNTMEDSMSDRDKELSLATSEKKVLSPAETQSSKDTCQAEDDTTMEDDMSNTDTELLLASAAKKESSPANLQSSNNTICQAADDSVTIKSENCDANVEIAAIQEETDQMQSTDDASNKYSADLFPEGSSLEDVSVAGASNSADLFPSPDLELESLSGSQELNESTPDSEKQNHTLVLNTTPDCLIPLPKLEPLENHSIMFSPHIKVGLAPRPYPSSYRDKWDSLHVRMPCSPMSRFPVETANGEKRIESRWDLICQSLKSDIGTSKELEAAIMSYNNQYKEKWNFQGLHAFINKHWNEAERDYFFESMLPSMIEMTLQLPDICTQPVPLMKTDKDSYVTMSQKQIGCLLLNAFFCTFPRRNSPGKVSRHETSQWEYANYPGINFSRLFIGVKNTISSTNAEKLKCLFNYFRRITLKEPTGTVTFHRQYLNSEIVPNWHGSSRGIRNAIIHSEGLIESDGKGMLQVDFANQYIGGGVLGNGCVQEEIRFVICPELIVARLFVEKFDNKESLIVTGAEQYNKYSGYGDTFKWEGDFRDNTPRDAWGRLYTQVVAIDALEFRSTDDQFQFHNMKRELTKAYSGFYEDAPPVHLPAIATGNWGCGAFKGNPNLKFLIQLMAASEAGRSLVYFTFGNRKLKQDLCKMHKFLIDKNLAVGDLWRLLVTFLDKVNFARRSKPMKLYNFIYSQFAIKENSKKQDVKSEDLLLSNSGKTAAELLFKELMHDTSSDIKRT